MSIKYLCDQEHKKLESATLPQHVHAHIFDFHSGLRERRKTSEWRETAVASILGAVKDLFCNTGRPSCFTDYQWGSFSDF